MITIGIVGGVASGKSAVADQLRRLGATVIDADRMGHQVLEEPAVIAAARARWGDGVLDERGQIRRGAVADRVFGSSPTARQDLEYWESCTHPRITARLRERLDSLRGRSEGVVVLDAAVMFKSGWDRLCDELLFVDVPRRIRLARAMDRGWTEEEFREREASQLLIEEKRRRASFVIDNTGRLEQTYEQVLKFWNSFSA